MKTNALEDPAMPDGVNTSVNVSATSPPGDASLTHPRSLTVLARALARHRPSLPQEVRPHVTDLIMMAKRYPGNPDGIRPGMLAVIERIEEMRS